MRRARNHAEALEIDARADDLGLAARRGELRLELAAQVFGDADDGGGASDDVPRGAGDAWDRADVPDVPSVRGDDERRALDRRRDQPGRHEEVRVDDMRTEGSGGPAGAAEELEVAALAAAPAVEDG